MRSILLLVLVSANPWPATASEDARVGAIRIEGNRVTREGVILRELPLRVGDSIGPGDLDAARQAVLDLGLFRSVEVDTEESPGGSVVVVTVREKRYLLPIPRIDVSSDEDTSYGAQLRWDNLLGLNHSLNAVYEEGRFPNDQRREKETTARIDYTARRLGGAPWDLRGRVEYEQQETPGADGDFEEYFRRASLVATRDLTVARPRRGWIVGGGLEVEDQTTEGEFAPPADGLATALVGTATFDDLRYRVYSETGTRLSVRLRAASSAVLSDYGYSQSDFGALHSRAVGATPHQTLQWLGAGGVYSGGPGSRNAYTLGGSGAMRGYPPDFLEGDSYYYGAVEFLRPVRWDWLRLLLVAEAGGAARANPVRDIEGETDGSPYASVGLGIRIRFTTFVRIEIEAGVAWPLRGGDGARFFAGGN